MAKMYPATISNRTRSPGEAEVFRLLESDPLAEDWTVLHSLNIADHLRQVEGEIDFLAIVPSKGVLCLEVKAVQSVRRENGLWYSGTRAAPEARGPFRQAADSMHSLRNRLAVKDPSLSRVVFWSAVLFPYIEFTIESPEWHPWQAIDARQYHSISIGRIVVDILDKARDYLRASPSASWFEGATDEPTPKQCKAILGLLRPDFELFEPVATKAEKRETELRRFTDEQFEALDVMSENQRVLFSGPAGTGKTFLAMEAARRGRAEDRRILMLCFNRLLGVWLREQMSELSPDVTPRTIHRYMLEVAGIEPPPSPTRAFWEHELPQRAIERLLEDSTDSHSFDELIVDEAQDLFRAQFVDCLDVALRGGLSEGKWRCFGDLERQSLFSSNPDVRRIADTKFGSGARYGLRVNCRNTPRIAEYVHLLASLSPPYSHVRRPDNGMEPETKRYSSSHGQRELLAKAIGDLELEGFRPEDIVVLSSLSEERCVASALGLEWEGRLESLRSRRSAKRIRYGSVFAFKGLEAPAVIVTDIESVKSEHAKDVLYVGATRALDRLIILVGDDAGRDLLEILASSAQGKTAHD